MLPIIGEASLEEEFSTRESPNEIIVSNNDLILIFSVAIAVVIGIFLYLARNSILRRKGEYEKADFKSKKNRDYEKYHSDWTSDDTNFGPNPFNAEEEGQYRKSLDSSALPNYYNILGVPVDATQEEIKIKFRRLVKEWHPDKNKEAFTEKKMSEINTAYEILFDKERRKIYDKYLNLS